MMEEMYSIFSQYLDYQSREMPDGPCSLLGYKYDHLFQQAILIITV